MSDLAYWLQQASLCHKREIDYNLERIREVAERLGVLPIQAKPCIVVAGTNGKGTTVALLSAALRLRHQRVGTFSSPHLLDFRERILINGCFLPEPEYVQAFVAVEQARQTTPLTFFEYTTLVALYLFWLHGVDAMVLEAGMGGRLDAVNIVEPSLSIITSIDLDHTDWLGETREVIALEKAGILRPGQAAVCGDSDPPGSLLTYVEERSIPLLVQGRDFGVCEQRQTWDWWSTKQGVETGLPMPHIPVENVATALAGLALLGEFPTREQLIVLLQQVRVMGRYQRLGQVIVDVAHNPHGARWLAKRLEADMGPDTRLWVVFGSLADKDWEGVVRPFVGRVQAWFTGDLGAVRPCWPAEHLAQGLCAQGEVATAYPDIQAALQAALEVAQSSDLILAFGSFYTVSGVLKQIAG